MGVLNKQYLRFSKSKSFGVVGCGKNICFLTRQGDVGKYVAVSASDNVIIWEMRRNVQVLTLNCELKKATVTTIEARPTSKKNLSSGNTHIAVGYSDGTLAIFDAFAGQFAIFNGHRTGISSLCWDQEGMRIATAGDDGEIVIWDVVSERGVVRLLGHKGRINRVRFLKTRNVLVSGGRDGTIRFYDLETNHCFKTMSPYQSEIIDFDFLREDSRLITAMATEGLLAWKVVFQEQSQQHINSGEEKEDKKLDEDLDLDTLCITEMGRFVRKKEERISSISTDGRILACHGKSLFVDFFLMLTDEEIEARKEKRMKKLRKRARESETKEEMGELDKMELQFEVRVLPCLKSLGRVNGISLLRQSDGVVKVCALHSDNRLGFYQCQSNLTATEKKTQFELTHELSRPSHRTEIRCIAFTSLTEQIISASSDSIKVWHRSNGQCTMTLPCEYALSMVIPPGDRHVVIGTKSGLLQLFDLNSGVRLESVEAHAPNERDQETGIYSLCITSDSKCFISGGADCLVKFWYFELIEDKETGRGKRLSFVQDSRVLKVADSITCLRCSKDGRFLAAATLDLKETIFYFDSLKLVHELYGKSLPASCMDFSADGSIIATGSVDSIVRIFGTDFGDLRKMLKSAHEGGVTDLKFLAHTHMFFTCGHDGLVKQWDADNFQRISTLEGHLGIVRCLSTCSKGNWLVSSGKDRFLRLWQKTSEPLVLGDEREQERQQQEEQQELGLIQRPVVAGEKNAAAVRPTKTTFETEKAADQLLEAICIFRTHLDCEGKGVPNQIMTMVYKTNDPYKFILLVLKKIKSSELEEAIIMLPYNRVLELLVAVKGIVDREWDIELSSRVLITAVRINFPQLIASKSAHPIIRALTKSVPNKLQYFQDIVGVNYAALRHLRSRFEEREESQLFAEAATKVKQKRRKQKNKQRNAQRVILTI